MSKSLFSFFQGFAAKRLSDVEVHPKKSNQHELNGINKFKAILGTEKRSFNGKFIHLSDIEEGKIYQDCKVTWYDAREKHETRTEYRLYYSENDVIKAAAPGDLLIIGKINEKELAIITASKGSTSEKQLLWLFGQAEVGDKTVIKDLSASKNLIGYAEKQIISYLGFDTGEDEPDDLEMLLAVFKGVFPSTNEFSEFTRKQVKGVDPKEDPDSAILAWLQKEESFFKTLEKHFVAQKLKTGFGKGKTDAVEEFISFSLSVQNRRKSRAGHSFENHLASIFTANKLRFSHGKITEGTYKPDFLFPGQKEYQSSSFNVQLLTMLGVKTTAKDRWRQILSEAKKIWPKHLITLEPSISKNQTDQMKDEKVQLVVPKELITTYSAVQQKEIINLKDFVGVVLDRQSKL